MRLRLTDPKGKVQIEAIQILDFKDGTRARLMANLSLLPAAAEGIYVWHVALKQRATWKRMSTVSYSLRYLKTKADANKLARIARKRAATFS